MREVIRSSKFKRDVKLALKRGKDTDKLSTLILLLLKGDPLPDHYRDHALSGAWKHYRDCHIEPDWLLLYRVDAEALYLARTGTHADLLE